MLGKKKRMNTRKIEKKRRKKKRMEARKRKRKEARKGVLNQDRSSLFPHFAAVLRPECHQCRFCISPPLPSTPSVHPNTSVQILPAKYFHQNTSSQILPSKYFHPNTSIQILPSKYFHQNTPIKIPSVHWNTLNWEIFEKYHLLPVQMFTKCWQRKRRKELTSSKC